MSWLYVVSTVVVVIFVIIPVAFSYWQAWRLVHPDRKAFQDHPRNYGINYEDITIQGKAGNLAAWYLPGTNGRTLIALHGINDNRQQWLPPGVDLQRIGFNVLLLDFRGHGGSEGKVTTFGDRETEDVLAVLDYLQNRGDIDMQRIGLMGLSLGGIAAIIAASRTDRVQAVMAEAAFPDLLRDLGLAFTRFTGVPAFPLANLTVFWGQFMVGTSLAKLRPIEVIHLIAPRPVFIIGDLNDNLVDEPHGSQGLYDRAGEPKQLWQLPNTRHVGGYEVFGAEYIDRVSNFFTQAL